MLLSKSQKIAEWIVIVLAKAPGSSAEFLCTELAKCYRKVTRQAVYKEVGRLIREGVVLRVNKRYELSLAWVSNLHSFSQKMFQAHTSLEYLLRQMPKEGKKTRFTFGNLTTLDRFYIHASHAIAIHSGSRTLLNFFPHPYFELNHEKVHPLVEAAFRSSKIRSFSVVGGDSPLDKALVKNWSREVFGFRIGSIPHDRQTYSTVSGPYIITAQFPIPITQKIEELFHKSRSLKDVAPEAIYSIFYSKGRHLLSIENSPQKADRLYKIANIN